MRVDYAKAASRDLLRYRSDAKRLISAIDRYAQSGIGDVKALSGLTGFRLRVGDYRILFEKTDSGFIITRIGPRGSIYE
jgi:mRNA interferase RelE/StbE